MNILIIKKIHSMILSKSTGKPKELALKLNVSERTIYNYIHFMRKDLKAPIIYNRFKDTYQYDRNCNINFIHNEKKKKKSN
jgi:transcriptional antiterminator